MKPDGTKVGSFNEGRMWTGGVMMNADGAVLSSGEGGIMWNDPDSDKSGWLLDRLDDGWKPFWLDTLAIDPGQTQRIAFSAEYAGRWLIEAVETSWAAPRLVRWYSVE